MVMSAEPLWRPSPDDIEATRINRFRGWVNNHALSVDTFPLADVDALHAWSVEHPGAFWAAVWKFFGVIGDPGDTAHVPAELPEAKFFPHATLNLAENILGYASNRDDAGLPILVVTAEMGTGIGILAQLTRDQLIDAVAETTAALIDRGVRPGDRVALVLPAGLDAYIVNLAGLAIGAVMCSASPDFGVAAIVDRFAQLDPVLLVGTTSYRWNGKRHDRQEHLVDLARSLPSLRSLLIVPGTDDLTASVDPDIVDRGKIAALIAAGQHRPLQVSLLSEARAVHEGVKPHFEQLPFDHPAYILFSSGTTGKPKCLIHRQGGVLLKHLVEAGLHVDARPGDRVLFYTTTGWMMWNWAATVPATGATLVLHDGAPNFPAVDTLFDIANRTQLTHLGVGARLLESMRTEHVEVRAERELSDLRMLMVTGSPLTEVTAKWVVGQLGENVQPNPISGGTDLVGCFLSGDPTRPMWAGELPGIALGMDVDVVDDDGASLQPGIAGELICRNTFPTVPLGIWGDEDRSRLQSTYFEQIPGVWTHGDLTSRTTNGGFIIHGRSDATLNIAGVRIGTGEIYSALEEIDEVNDALAFAQVWQQDTRMVLLVVLHPGSVLTDALQEEIRQTLRSGGSPRHVPALILAVADLPRTLTGKLAEVAVASIVNGRPVRNRDALANPAALDAIAIALQA